MRKKINELKIVVSIGAYPPDHSGAGKRIRATYGRIHQDASIAGTTDSTIQWSVLAHPVRLPSNDKDDNNVTRVKARNKLAIILACIKILLTWRPDVVHCVGLSKIAVCSAWAALILRISYIVELSIYPPADTLATVKNRIFQHPLRKANGYIALTPMLRDYFRGLSKTTPIFLRINPVTLKEEALLEPSDRPEKLPHLLLGRFSKRKGHRDALKTLAGLPSEHRLVLAGPVIGTQDERYLESLRVLSKQLNVHDRVEFNTTYVKDVASLINRSRSVWCFSEREGLPNVVLESLWCGRPVFVNESLGLSNIVLDGVNGMNLPADTAEKAQSINRALKNGFNSEQIKQMAYEAFDLRNHADETLQFIKRVILKTDFRSPHAHSA